MGARKSFAAGFAACYLLCGVIFGRLAADIPATTTAGAIYGGAMWLPINLLPIDVSVAMTPSWVFDFEESHP